MVNYRQPELFGHIQMVVALKPLHDRFQNQRIVVSTYQSVTGAGKKKGMTS